LQSYDRDGRFRDGGAVLVDAGVEYYAQATRPDPLADRAADGRGRSAHMKPDPSTS